MRILQINSVCGTGSTGKIAVDLYNVLKDNGHECKIAYGRGEARGIPTDNTIKIGSKADVYIHTALARLTDKSGFYSKHATKRFLKAVDEYKPDIIHLHNIHGYYINIELLFKYIKEKKIPVVWTLHDCWSFTGHCAYFDYAGCEKWKNGCYACVCKNQYPKSLTDNSKRNYAKKKELFSGIENMTIVTPSKWLAGKVKDSYLKDKSVEIIYNGIDLNIFNPVKDTFREKHNLTNKKILLAVSSIWDRRKGIGEYIKLSKRLSDKYQIVLVGKLPDMKLPDDILHIERTQSQKELAEIYSTADAFLNLSLEDNFPSVNIEALACGTPVITYETGGCGEAIDEYSGIAVPQGNTDAVIKNIDKTFDSGGCLSRGRKFDKDEKFKEYLVVYERCKNDI